MESFLCLNLFLLTFISKFVSGLYYPPILSPASGDVIPAGSNFTAVWDTKIPDSIVASQVANFTSQVRLGIYLGPPPPNEIYEEWTLYSPSNSIGDAQPLYFYENQGPHIGHAEFEMPTDICSETVKYVVVWYDAYPDEIFSGEFWVNGGC